VLLLFDTFSIDPVCRKAAHKSSPELAAFAVLDLASTAPTIAERYHSCDTAEAARSTLFDKVEDRGGPQHAGLSIYNRQLVNDRSFKEDDIAGIIAWKSGVINKSQRDSALRTIRRLVAAGGRICSYTGQVHTPGKLASTRHGEEDSGDGTLCHILSLITGRPWTSKVVFCEEDLLSVFARQQVFGGANVALCGANIFSGSSGRPAHCEIILSAKAQWAAQQQQARGAGTSLKQLHAEAGEVPLQELLPGHALITYAEQFQAQGSLPLGPASTTTAFLSALASYYGKMGGEGRAACLRACRRLRLH
jgi:hypothetical protein